jgi:tetratricopeptide (TPR) repeat protein
LFLLLTLLAGCAKSPEARAEKFMEQGRRHFAERDYSRALIDFRNAAQVKPKDAEPYYQMALVHLAMNNAQGAVNALLWAAQLDAKHAPTQLKLAELMSMNRSVDVVRDAQKKAEEILTSSPGNPDALYTLAVTELRLNNDSASATKYLEEALARVPQHLKATLMLAAVKLRQQDPAGAEQVLEKAVREAPKSAEHALAAGQFYLVLRKPEQAEREFRRALELDGKSGPALVALGSFLLRSGRKDEAGQLFKRCSQLNDKSFHAVYSLFLLQTNQTEAAIAEMQRLYKADPEDREARNRLVATYLRLGQRDTAEKILTEALAKNAKDVDALLQRGELLVRAGRTNDAQKDVNQALQFRPDSAQGHLLLSRIYAARGQASLQRQELTEALNLDPNLLPARVELAHAMTVNNSARTALELLDKAPEEQQRSIELIAERNTALLILSRYAEVRKLLDQNLAASRNPILLMQDGLLRFNQKDFAGARAAWREVLGQNPQEWRAVEAIALSHLAENKPAEAVATVREHAASLPKSAIAQHLLGVWLTRVKDLEGARAAFQSARSLDPDLAMATISLAELDMSEQKLDSARETLTAALKKDPRGFAALVDLAQVEFAAGRVPEAIGYYERALQEAPDHVPAMNNLAYILADTGADLDRALKLAQKAKELAPDDPAVNDTIGWTYYHKGMYPAALEYLRKAETDSSPVRKCHLAMVYIKLGDKQKAAATLQPVLKQHPSLPEAQKAMQLLSQLQ